jgi:DNA-binding transcriptional ArsR family regulator
MNRHLIIRKLLDHPLSFGEIVKKTGVSRASVNHHLKEMMSEGIIIKKMNLYDLEPSKVNLVKWFLSQLPQNVPDRLIQEGKALLNEENIAYFSLKLFVQIQLLPIIIPLERPLSKIANDVLKPLFTIRKTPITFDLRFKTKIKNEPILMYFHQIRHVLNCLDPSTFTFFMVTEYIDALREEVPVDMKKLEYTVKLSAIFRWWTKVMSYLPSSSLMSELAIIYKTLLLKVSDKEPFSILKKFEY